MEREIIVAAVMAIYLIGFFAMFFISTRNGDEFVEVILFSIMWPFIVASIPVIAVGLGLSWLYVKIKGDGR
ncbi:hypothetical protein ACAY19_002306 [Serratia liquefaciens]